MTFCTGGFLGILETDKGKSEMKEPARVPAIKLYRPEDFYCSGPSPRGKPERTRRENEREREREREREMKGKQQN